MSKKPYLPALGIGHFVVSVYIRDGMADHTLKILVIVKAINDRKGKTKMLEEKSKPILDLEQVEQGF